MNGILEGIRTWLVQPITLPGWGLVLVAVSLPLLHFILGVISKEFVESRELDRRISQVASHDAWLDDGDGLGAKDDGR